MRWAALMCMMLILSLSACALETVIFGDEDAIPADTWYSVYEYSTYSRSSNNPWVGRSRDELIEALGPPEFVYEARPIFSNDWADGFPAYTYVYRGDTNSPGHCIDAYVVAEPTSTVIKYYCR